MYSTLGSDSMVGSPGREVMQMVTAIRMRCDGCGDVRERWTSGLGLGKHRVLGVVCGTWSVVLDDDESSYLDDIQSLPDEDAPRYVTQVEEAQARWSGGVVTTLDAPRCPKCARQMTTWGFQIVNDRDSVVYICDGENAHSLVREVR